MVPKDRTRGNSGDSMQHARSQHTTVQGWSFRSRNSKDMERAEGG